MLTPIDRLQLPTKALTSKYQVACLLVPLVPSSGYVVDLLTIVKVKNIRQQYARFRLVCFLYSYLYNIFA